MTLKAKSIQTSKRMVHMKTRRVVLLSHRGRGREKEGCDWRGDAGQSPKVQSMRVFKARWWVYEYLFYYLSLNSIYIYIFSVTIFYNKTFKKKNTIEKIEKVPPPPNL